MAGFFVCATIPAMATLTCDQDHEHGGKCYGDAIPAFAGATSWEELDAAEEAAEAADRAQHAVAAFQGIVQSIVYSADLTPDEKASRLEAAAAGLGERIRGEVEEEAKVVRPGVLGRLLGRKVTNSEGLGPDDYAVVGDPDQPSTWKLRIDDAAHISGAIQALSPGGFRGQRVELEAGERSAALRKIRTAVERLPEADRGNMPDRLAALKAIAEPTRPGAVAVLAGKTGGYERFAIWSSNNFEDREGEVFPAAVIEAAAERFNARQAPKGYVNIWHVGHPRYGWPRRDMSDWGEIEHAAYADGFLLLEGRVTDPAVAAKIADWGKREPLGSSIEYEWQPGDLVEGVYHAFDFDRVSVVPRSAAANPWGPDTSVYLGRSGGGDMIADQKVRSALAEIYGDEQVKAWEAEATTKATELRAAGRASKALSFELPGPTIRFVEEDVKDGAPAPTADATPAVTEATDAVAAVTETTADEPPPWAKQLADQNAAILARLDQQEAAVKAVKDELENAAPAVGVLGRSVQNAALSVTAGKELDAQEAAVRQYEQTGQLPPPTGAGDDMADWGVAGKIAAQFNGNAAGRGPAGS